MRKVNIISCGKVGKTLGRLWNLRRVFIIGDILNRSLQSSAEAADFIGAGTPVPGYEQMRPADLYLVAAADSGIAECAERLCRWGLISGDSIVCHLSGALPSSVLRPAVSRGGLAASVHPVRSFVDPAVSAETFDGTWCGIEGDRDAFPILQEAFRAIGGRTFPIDPEFKTLYHCGSVIVCNYLTALIEAGVRTYGKGGLPRETALRVMEPLVRGTLENIFRSGTAEALTGPIARGDADVVARQLEALDGWDRDLGRLYRLLGKVALELAVGREGATLDPEPLRKILLADT